MKRIVPLTVMLFALAACDEAPTTKTPAASAAPQATAVAATTAAATAVAAADSDIATEDDFADEAAQQITASNLDSELDSLEKEIGE